MFLGYFAGHTYKLALAGLPALLKMFSLWLEAFISIPCGLLLTIKKKIKKSMPLFCAHLTPVAWASCSFHPQHPDPVDSRFLLLFHFICRHWQSDFYLPFSFSLSLSASRAASWTTIAKVMSMVPSRFAWSLLPMISYEWI